MCIDCSFLLPVQGLSCDTVTWRVAERQDRSDSSENRVSRALGLLFVFALGIPFCFSKDPQLLLSFLKGFRGDS